MPRAYLQSSVDYRSSKMTREDIIEAEDITEEVVVTAESFWNQPKSDEDSSEKEEYFEDETEDYSIEVPDDVPIVDRPAEDPPDEMSTTGPWKKWRFVLGLSLAFISGLVFTGNNCVIQSFDLDFAETLLVRSVIQIVVVGLVLAVKGYHPWPRIGDCPNRTRALIIFQGFLGGLMIMCAFCAVLYLPLGDALTLIFSAPLSTMVIAAIILKHSLRLYKITFGLLLLVGTILVVRPPFIFTDDEEEDPDNVTMSLAFLDDNQTQSLVSNFYAQVYYGETEQIAEVLVDDKRLYFIGVTIALSSALLQGFLNVSVNFCQKVPSIVLLFWAGVGGLIVSLSAFTFDERARILGPRIYEIPYSDWVCFVFMAFSGMAAYLSLTKALQLVDPTVAAFMRSLEIVFAYIMQAAIMQSLPPMSSIMGASLVMFSVSAIALQKHFMAVIPERLKPIF